MNHRAHLHSAYLPKSVFGEDYLVFDQLDVYESISDLFSYRLIVKAKDEHGNPAHGIRSGAGRVMDYGSQMISGGIDAGGKIIGQVADGVSGAVSGWFGGDEKTEEQPKQKKANETKPSIPEPITPVINQTGNGAGNGKAVASIKGDCVCQGYDLIWGAHPNVTCEFRKKVVEICKDLWPDNYLQMANNLMALMHLETAGTFSPSKGNGKGYYGLIQFGKLAAQDLNTTTTYLRKLSAVEQLDWVKKYFQLRNRYKKVNSFVEMYLLILYPKAVTGQRLQDNDIVFDYQKKAYRANPAFMKEQGERESGGFSCGTTYVWEVKQEIESHYKDGEKSVNREFRNTCNSISKPVTQSKSMGVLDEMKKFVDQHIPYSQSGERGSLSQAGLKAVDCSETVALYLTKLGLMNMKAISTHTMTTEKAFQNTIGSKNIVFVKGSNKSDFIPQRGDIFVWRTTVGHTGIVYQYNAKNDTVTILEAIGAIGSSDETFNKANGGSHKKGCSRTAVYRRTGGALSAHAGWVGYFRPINYTRSL